VTRRETYLSRRLDLNSRLYRVLSLDSDRLGKRLLGVVISIFVSKKRK